MKRESYNNDNSVITHIEIRDYKIVLKDRSISRKEVAARYEVDIYDYSRPRDLWVIGNGTDDTSMRSALKKAVAMTRADTYKDTRKFTK